MKKVVALALLCLGFVALSCEEEKPVVPEEEVVTSLKIIGNDSISIYVGDTAFIDIEYRPENAPAPQLYYFGYDQLVLKAYQEENMVIGRKRGTTKLNIGIRQSDVSVSCVINVLPESFNLLYADAILCVGDTLSLKAFLPSDAAQYIRWESSKPSVATIDINGVVKGLSSGVCDITAVAFINNDTVYSNKCHLTVRDVNMASLVLSDSVREVVIHETFKLNAMYEPSNTTFADVSWSSSDTCVATVDVNGNVKGVGFGSCIISAINNDSTQKACCNVIVGVRKMTSISLYYNEMNKIHHDVFNIESFIEPVDASMDNNALRWKSSDASVATVDEFTGRITCVTPGECVITAYNIYSTVSDSCHLVVSPRFVSDISLKDTMLYLGSEKKLECMVLPLNATDNRIRWESSDNSVATVDAEGKVKAVGLGTATITVSALDAGGCIGQSVVDVQTIFVKKIRFNNVKEDTVLLVLDSIASKKIEYRITPDSALNKEVEWKSSDEGVVRVDPEGNIEAVAMGTATVSITALDGGGCSNNCNVKVVDKQWCADEYVKNDIVISFMDSISLSLPVSEDSLTIYRYEVHNKGEQDTYIKQVKTINDMVNTVDKAVEAGKKDIINLNSKGIIWTFEHNGLECTKQ